MGTLDPEGIVLVHRDVVLQCPLERMQTGKTKEFALEGKEQPAFIVLKADLIEGKTCWAEVTLVSNIKLLII